MDLKEIEKSKNIAFLVDKKTICIGDALVSYALQLHKNAIMVSEDEFSHARYNYLSWRDKLRKEVSSSCDLVLHVEFDPFFVYEFFINNAQKINKKMATSLYGALLHVDDFKSNPNALKMGCALLDFGADAKKCLKCVEYSKTLAYIRQKGYMFLSMRLKENATVAVFDVDDEMLKKSGASLSECNDILKESFLLNGVRKAILNYDGKKIKEVCFE